VPLGKVCFWLFAPPVSRKDGILHFIRMPPGPFTWSCLWGRSADVRSPLGRGPYVRTFGSTPRVTKVQASRSRQYHTTFQHEQRSSGDFDVIKSLSLHFELFFTAQEKIYAALNLRPMHLTTYIPLTKCS
jgi:hypothetical protein